MTAFFADLLDDFLSPAFLEKVRVKFHYEETQAEALKAVAEEMYPLLCREAFWERRRAEGQAVERAEDELPACLTSLSETQYERVVMSLGAGLDALQERYSGQGRLSQSYMLEVLAGELLMQGYGAYNRYIAETTVWHVARYHFPGSEEAYPLEMLPDLLKGFTGQVTCNEAFCMIPKKSVVFVSELTQDEKMRCEGICIGCNSAHCANRAAGDSREKQLWARMADVPLGYGYSRILGKL
ncbi:MAG: hypothetical protein K2N80_17555 [Lachnospiraceae bacterium]|nr:hypothetical protein [Lachnospiraceae bacterium]